MIQLLIFQIGILLFAISSGVEEAAFTYPFREITFDLQTKFKKLKQAHRAGAVGVAMILIVVSLAELEMTGRVVPGILAGAACGLVYWLAFDISYSLCIGKGPFYIGATAATDGFLKRILGKQAGFIKAVFCLVAIITINLIFKSF